MTFQKSRSVRKTHTLVVLLKVKSGLLLAPQTSLSASTEAQVSSMWAVVREHESRVRVSQIEM